MVDSKFDVWLKTRKIDVEGRTPPKPKDTTILRDVILGCLSILFYYYCLTNFILPAYFNYRMPVSAAQAERTALLRSLEVSHPTPTSTDRTKHTQDSKELRKTKDSAASTEKKNKSLYRFLPNF
ncbi:hypothetical protein ANCCAN_11953 [Ancylostoma caninum]|uniref:Uncharacterized protein n=1 Tax=Ancylostoma caninum TaxID=29170 RepID=A0A368GCG1_ANCCA|nr:hypothetical protein ANCCAN_11953 [Ancylostoma caninum]